ncbi:MAG: response regulator [bacterium]|nr:response regulator [bacterium]
MKKILVVDDNIFNIRLVEAMMEPHYELITAQNGLEGIEKAREETPDLILMDVQMPKLNGIASMKEIRKIDRLKDVPIVAYTAVAMKGDKEKLLQDGFDDYLAKPISISNLVELVNKHIG